MPSLLLLDTCVLPRAGSVTRNAVLSALLRIAALQDATVILTDVSRTEAINARRVLATEAVEALKRAAQEIDKAFPYEQIGLYIPDPMEAVTAWTADLDEHFTIQPTRGEDAVEALHREANRQAPARKTTKGSATGSRDASIWLTARRLHLENEGQDTIFVSDNVNDFAGPDKLRLREELERELGDSATRFHYFVSAAAAVDHLAEKAALRDVDLVKLQELIEVGDLENQLLAALRASLDDEAPAWPLSLSINRLTESAAYLVSSTRLTRVSLAFGCLVGAGGDLYESDAGPVHGEAKAWLYENDGALTFDIESLQFDGSPLSVR